MAHSTPSVAPAATPTQNHAPEITVSPFYHSAVNAVTQPDKLTHTSQYFIDRWMPLLGGNGTMIVLALRRNGFLNRKTGECRDEIVLDGADIAAATGISEDTVIRELGVNKKTGKLQNEWLHYFVKKRQRRRRTAAGVLRQLENAYWISMDDPVHPDDWPRVVAAVQEAEERSQTYRRSPDTQTAYPVSQPDTQTAEIKPQTAAPDTQTAVEKPQSAYRLKNLYSSLPKKTLKTAALPGVSPSSLFPEEATEEEQPPAPPPWERLSDTERAPWLSQARQELVAIHAGSGITPRPKLIEVRGRNLYRAAQTASARSPVPPA